MKLYRSFATASKTFNGDKKAYVGYSVYRNSMALSVSPIKARFSLSPTGWMKNAKKGALLCEFIPFRDDPMDSQKISMLPKEKKLISLTSEHALQLLSIGDSPLEFKRNNRYDEKTLYITPEENTWKWSLVTISKTNDALIKSEIVIKPNELSMIQRLCEYSIPFMEGWQIIEDAELAVGSILTEDYNKPSQNDELN